MDVSLHGEHIQLYSPELRFLTERLVRELAGRDHHVVVRVDLQLRGVRLLNLEAHIVSAPAALDEECEGDTNISVFVGVEDLLRVARFETAERCGGLRNYTTYVHRHGSVSLNSHGRIYYLVNVENRI